MIFNIRSEIINLLDFKNLTYALEIDLTNQLSPESINKFGSLEKNKLMTDISKIIRQANKLVLYQHRQYAYNLLRKWVDRVELYLNFRIQLEYETRPNKVKDYISFDVLADYMKHGGDYNTGLEILKSTLPERFLEISKKDEKPRGVEGVFHDATLLLASELKRDQFSIVDYGEKLRELTKNSIVAVFSDQFEDVTTYFNETRRNLEKNIRYFFYSNNIRRLYMLRKKLIDCGISERQQNALITSVNIPKEILAIAGHQAVIIGPDDIFGTMKRIYDKKILFTELPKDDAVKIKDSFVDPILDGLSEKSLEVKNTASGVRVDYRYH